MTKKNKEKTLGIRVNEDEMTILENFCDINKTTRSKVVRTAISTYIQLNLVNHVNPNSKMVISQNMVKPLFNIADNSTIEEIAKISKNNTVSNGKLIFKDYKDVKFGSNRKEAMNWVINSIIENKFRSDANNWFEKIRFNWEGDNLKIVGRHNLGPKFSLFIRHYLSFILQDYKYQLKKEDFQNSKHIENGIEDFRELIVLVFSPIKND